MKNTGFSVKLRSVCLQTLCYIIAIALCLGGWALGYIFNFGLKALFIALSSVLGAVIIAAAVINICILRKRGGIKAIGANRRELSFADAQAAYKRNIKLAYVYIISLAAVIVALCYCIGQCNTNAKSGGEKSLALNITFCIVAVFLLTGLIELLILKEDCAASPLGNRISSADFPLLYDVCNRAAKAAECDKPIKLYLCEEGLTVANYKKHLAVSVCLLYAAKMTADELTALLTHEIKICKADETAAAFSSDVGNVISMCSKYLLALFVISAAASSATALYEAKKTAMQQEADEYVINTGSAQTYVNALGKKEYAHRFFMRLNPEIDYEFYVMPRPESYAQKLVSAYDAAREKYGSLWHGFMLRELSEELLPYTFKFIMLKFGCEDFNAESEEQDPFYAAEQQKTVVKADELFGATYFNKYQLLRKTEYLQPKKITENYEKKLLSGETPTADEHIAAMQAFTYIDPNKALAIADAIIADTPDEPSANFTKGEILYNSYDDGCIQYFKVAARDVEYEDTAMFYLLNYALDTGDEPLIDEYMQTEPELTEFILRTKNFI